MKDNNLDTQPTVTNQGKQEAIPQILAHGVSQDTQQEQIVTFVDNNPSVMEIFEEIEDPTFTSDLIPSADLGNFLERPVLIDTVRWVESTPYVDYSFNPWHAFFTHPIIKKKIDNYAFVNCNLHVKAVINASPFYYGAMLLSYRPLLTFGLETPPIVDRALYCSQRPHFWILPQTNTAGELQLPFFYHKNWLRLTDTDELTNMGRIDLTEVGTLKQANGVSGAGIDIQIYAWASNPILAGPTYQLQSGFEIQSGRGRTQKSGKSKPKAKQRRNVSANTTSTSEYEQGPVEKVSSTVANIANKLSDVPVIGSFAKATEYGARAVAGISSLFGWTNVPVISDVEPLKSVPFHALASAEIGVPADRLTLDPKNELTIDPRTVGLQGCDELTIANLVQRELLVSWFTWDETQTAGDQLFGINVNPVFMGSGGGVLGVYSALMLSPMGMVATNFQYWRGDIIYRFKAICTQYHKGRLRITWDPVADLAANSDTTETSFTKIVDLAPDMDIEIRVSYLQDTAYLQVRDIGSAQHRVAAPFPVPTHGYDNGSLTVRILNDLTGPAADATVDVLVFARGCENMSFMNPRDPLHTVNQRVSWFVPQSSEEVIYNIQSDTNEIADTEEVHDDLLPQIFGGEAIKSMRNILRRAVATAPVPIRPVSGSTSGSDWNQVYSRNQGPLPDTQGFDPSGWATATGPISGVPEPCSYGYFSAFSLMVPCFIGYRGSMIWHFNMQTQNKVQKVHQVQRRVSLRGTVDTGTIYSTADSGVTGMIKNMVYGIPEGAGGQSLTNCETQTGLQVLMPFYSNLRMRSTDPTHWINGTSTDGSDYDTYTYNTVACPQEDSAPLQSAVLMRYYGIGPDFNLFFFLNAPVLYLYDDRPE